MVKKGDTLEKIADKLDTSVTELMSANGLKKTSVLQPGDVIKGPAVTKKAYVVAKGDTVFSIAKRFHVSVDELRAENDLSTKTAIRPGQQIRLPADYKAPSVEAADDQPTPTAKVIPDEEALKAAAEAGKSAFYTGAPRRAVPDKFRDDIDLAAAFWGGFDAAKKEDMG